MKKVSDPALLQQLNAPVSDPDLLAQLNAPVSDASVLEQLNAPQEEPERSWGDAYDDFSLGLGKSLGETYQGVRDLTPWPVDDTSKRALEMMREDVKGASGWADAGNITGEVAQFALPAGGLLKGGKALSKALGVTKQLSKAPKLAKALGAAGVVGTEVGSAGLVGAAKAPEEGKTRMDRAADEAQAALLGLGAGKVLEKTGSKLMRGIKRTPEADLLIEKGVDLTPAQASKGGLAKTLEYIAQVTPFTAKGVKQARDRSVESFSEAAMKEAAPEGYKKLVKAGGTEGAKQLKKTVDDAYSVAWGKAKKPSEESINSVLETGYGTMSKLSDQGKGTVEDALNEIVDLTSEFSIKKLKNTDNVLRKKINSANSGANTDFELSEALKEIRTKLRESAGDDAIGALKKVDSNYDKYLSVKKAGGSAKAMAEGGAFTPQQLLQASKTVGGETKAFTGEGPLRDFAEAGATTIGQKMPNPILNVMKGAVVNLPPLAPMQMMGRAMLGKNIAQRGAQKLTEKSSPLIDALRRYGVSGGTLGAAIEGE